MNGEQAGLSVHRSIRLSVLFCDIKGFTSMARRLKGERINALLHEFIKSMSAVVHRHGGEIDKVMGDGILAFFPPSSTRRSTARQAVSAALAMQEQAGRLRKSWQDAGGDLLMRVGVATGPVEVSKLSLPDRRESSLIGHHVNLASRLQDMAPAGAVLVSRGTFLATKSVFEYQRIEDLEIKGFDDTVVAFRVEGRKRVPPVPPHSDSSPTRGKGTLSADGRRYRRVPLDIDLQVRTSRGRGTLRSINISEGGMFIATERPEPKGASVTIAARIPTTSGIFPIAIDGKVVWTGGEQGASGMGIRFTAVHSTEEETMSRLVRDIFSLRHRAAKQAGRDDLTPSAPLPLPGESPLFRGMKIGASFEELGTASPDMLSRQLKHEFDRARRYGTDFSCISLLVDLGSERSAQGDIREAFIAVSESLRESLRSTDEFAYFGDGLFFVLAPETLLNRAETLIKRTLLVIQSRLHRVEGGAESFIVRSGSSAFDRQAMSTPQEIMEAAVSSLSH